MTDISNIQGSFDDTAFDFKNENGQTHSCDCALRKYDTTPLYIVCFVLKEGKNWLSEIKTEKIYYDKHYNYNFRFQPVKNDEIIYYSRNTKGAFIISYYPSIFVIN